jgi:hypothetical protein
MRHFGDVVVGTLDEILITVDYHYVADFLLSNGRENDVGAADAKAEMTGD